VHAFKKWCKFSGYIEVKFAKRSDVKGDPLVFILWISYTCERKMVVNRMVAG
jgi:hypothetical protein